MTATTDRVDGGEPGPPADDSDQQTALRRRPADWLGNRVDVWCIALLVAFAAILRFVDISNAYDVFVDELFYQGVARSVGQGHIPPHIPAGWGQNTADVFLLHPPGFFALLGMWQHITGTGGDVFHQVFLARGLNALLGAASAGLLFVLGRRLAGRWVGIAAALIFALDPFILRQNGRVLLETATLFWVLAGYIVLVGMAQGRYRRPQQAAVAVGVLFGCAVLTKDAVSIETVGTVLILAAFGWGIPRRLALRIVAVAAATYLTYVVACVYQGYGGEGWDVKTLGIRRQLGLVQITGFNRPGSVSLTGTLWSEATSFATSYVLVALGVGGAAYLLRSRRDDYRVLGVFVGTATVFMAYAGLFGTIEEQFLYFLLVPAILSVTTVSREIWRKTTLPGRRPSVASLALIIALTITTVWNLGVWAHIRTTPDNATQSTVAWLRQHARNSGPIAFINSSQSYTMSVSGLEVVRLGSSQDMAVQHVRYVVLSSRIADLNYSFATPHEVAYFEQHGRKVFGFKSATLGDVGIYETTDPGLW